MKDRTSLTELVFQQGKLKILRELLANPEREYSITELSEESETSYDLSYRFVQKLSELGLISKKKIGGSVIIQLNKKSPYTEKIRDLTQIDYQPLKRAAEKYANQLAKEKNIEAAVLFGSVAKGTPKTGSDIDILILKEEEIEKVERYANKLASKYEREEKITITPIVEDSVEFKEDLSTETPFAEEIKEHGKILTGEKPWQNGEKH